MSIKNVVQGVMGNLSEVKPEVLAKKYGEYIMDGEVIHAGFTLIRDVVIFTDSRLISINKQGATGVKALIETIYLDSIINVSLETAGIGVDDSKLYIEYITSPYYRVSTGVSTEKRMFEFPLTYNVLPLYRFLQETAYTNHKSINSQI